jgi:hypothetical protein
MPLEKLNGRSIFILLVITFILGYVLGSKLPEMKEHLINLDDSRKKDLTQCCKNPPCYYQPPYLRENCEENKKKAFKELDSQFKESYTQKEYYNKLNELNILKNKSNYQNDNEFKKKMNERLKVNLNETDFNKVIKDDRDEVKGFESQNFAQYKK